MTTWYCDTCKSYPEDSCVFEFNKDPLDPKAQIFVACVKKCSVHSHLSDEKAHEFALKENQMSEAVKWKILALDKSLSISDEDGNKFVDTKRFSRTFDKDRRLVVDLDGKKVSFSVDDDIDAKVKKEFKKVV